MGNVVVGHATRFGAGSANTVDEEYEFINCDLGADATHRQQQGIRGSRSIREEGVVEGTEAIGGTVLLEPRPDDLDNWLPRILGANGVAAETIPEFYAHVERIAEDNLYSGCKVARATFRCSSTQNLQLLLEIVGKTEASQAFPDIAASLSTMQPYVLHQGVLTINSNTYSMDNLEIVIDNGLLRDRYYNSQTRTEIPEGSRIVTVSFDNPFNADDTELYDIARAGLDGSVVFTNGNLSCDFTFANLKMPRSRQPIGGRDQPLDKRMMMQAYRTSGAAEIVITNDSNSAS